MPTTIKAAIKKWEEATGKKAAEAKEIKLIGVYPPIEKMEGPFHLLINCEKFSLSTNMISNINNLQAFKSLRILSLGRNIIKSLQGIEGAAETLEQLWISYNQIDRLKPIRSLQKLKVLYMSHNYVREWREFEHLTELPCLEDLVFVGNPLEEDSVTAQKYTDEVIKRLLFLKKLDGYPVIRELDNDEEEEVSSILDMNEIDRLAKGDSDDEEEEEEPVPAEHPRAEEDEHNPDDDDEENDSQVGSDAEDSVEED